MAFKQETEYRPDARIDGASSDVASWDLPPSTHAGPIVGSPALSELREKLINVVASNGLLELEEPVRLASGDMSRYFVDGKKALASGENLRLACNAIIEQVKDMGVYPIDAVGGLTLGADQFSHGVALIDGCEWFVVRKQPKGRGTNKRIEGADLVPGTRVLLVDDVVTRGGSIEEAYHQIVATGAQVVAAVTLVDRGGHGDAFFEAQGVPFRPLVTYKDLDIPAVGEE